MRVLPDLTRLSSSLVAPHTQEIASAVAELEPVAMALRDHQMELEDWRHADLARELHRWVEIFDVEFKLHLPAYPTLKFDRIRNAYATYASFRGVYGEKDTITFNVNELGRDPDGVHATLLHELLHLWQQYHGDPGKRNYHNKEFRDKALYCGLIVDARGCHSGHTDVFANVLSKYGIHAVPQARQLSQVPRVYGSASRSQKLKKYSCRCTTVRCATGLDATCNICHARLLPR